MSFFLVIFFIGARPVTQIYFDGAEACRYVLNNAKKSPKIYMPKDYRVFFGRGYEGTNGEPWELHLRGTKNQSFPIMTEVKCKREVYTPEPLPPKEFFSVEEIGAKP